MTSQKVIRVQGFHIEIAGEPNIGIFPGSWDFNGEIIFYGRDALIMFKDEFCNFLEGYLGERPTIQTYEERDEEIFREQEEYSN